NACQAFKSPIRPATAGSPPDRLKYAPSATTPRYQGSHNDPISAAPHRPTAQSPGATLLKFTGRRLALGGYAGCRLLEARGLQRVHQEHGDRHRADTARHGRYRRGLVLHGVEVDVADKAVVGAVNPDVDHDRALADVLGADQL